MKRAVSIMRDLYHLEKTSSTDAKLSYIHVSNNGAVNKKYMVLCNRWSERQFLDLIDGGYLLSLK